MADDLDNPLLSEFQVKTGMRLHDFPFRIEQIDVGHRLRTVDADRVSALKASIEELGLRTPITVAGDWRATKDASLRVRLVAGAHRLEAMRQLGREWIAAYVTDQDDLDAELWEIDENLCRAELTPADRALFVFRRKEIYLMKYPETAQGMAQARGANAARGGQIVRDVPSFDRATAEATGQDARTVRRDAERGEKISEKALRMLRGTRHDKGVVLDRLKSLRDEEQEVFVKALFDADKAREAEAKQIRTDKLQVKRTIRTGLINAIAAHGKVVAGEMPRAAFPIGYADPPWEQEAWSDETGQDKGLMYPPMPLEEIKALCAGEKSPFTRDALLFLWVTTNRLPDGIDVLKAWGFSFVSAITWDKQHIGMGRWVRDRTEHLLIGKRGDFPGLIPGTQPESLHSEAKGGHSRKPVWFAEEIERLFPDMRKLELFQRKASLAEGDIRLNGNWDFWGFEAGEPEAEEHNESVATVQPPETDPEADLKSKLPNWPTKGAPLELWIGGIRKGSFARFSIHLGDGGMYSVSASYDFKGFCGGAHPPTGEFRTLKAALMAALGDMAAQLRTIRSSTDHHCTASHKAGATAGLKWIDARMEEWGLYASTSIVTKDSKKSASVLAEAFFDEPEASDVPKPDADPVADAVLTAGLVPSAYILELNRGLTNPYPQDLPSRLFQHPVEFMDRKRTGAESRLLLRHPQLRMWLQVADFLDDIEEKTGICPVWQAEDEFGRDFGEKWRWYHAVDLCNDKHWKGLLKTAQFTDRDKICSAVCLSLQSKSLSVANARNVMGHLGSVEPTTADSAELMLGKALMPYRHDKSKMISPNISERDEKGAWLVIHGLEDGFFNYVGGHLSVTEEGMKRREKPDDADTPPLPLTMPEPAPIGKAG